MPRPFRLFAAAVLAVASAVATRPAAAQSVTAFVGVTVVPMDREGTIADQTVIVRDGRIAEIGPRARVTVPAGAVRIDGSGKYLMPGLAEMHAHVPPQQSVTEAQLRDIMFLYVANGVTTIRGMLGAPYQLELRDRLARGDLLGPTLYVGAPSLNGNSAPTPDSAAALVRAHKAAGYDFLKLHPGLTRPVYDAVVRTSREVGITFAGHISTPVGLAHTLASRQGSIDHLDGYLEATLPAALQARIASPTDQVQLPEVILAADAARLPSLARLTREAGVFNVPTAFLWESFFGPDTPEEMAARPEMRYASPQAVAAWANQKRNRIQLDAEEGMTPEVAAAYLEFRRQTLKALADAGAPLLMGTDSPQMFNVPGFALHREIEVMRAAGLTPFQILESGTRNVARYTTESLRLPGGFGTVEVGGRADLILTTADPLADVSNVGRRAGVMVRGRWIPEAEIQRGLEELAGRLRPA
jgi:imidazolonepropionase-like amidohydrolase